MSWCDPLLGQRNDVLRFAYGTMSCGHAEMSGAEGGIDVTEDHR